MIRTHAFATLLAALAGFAASTAASGEPIVLHVDLRGSDSGDGSAEHPLASIAAAQRRVRDAVAAGGGPIRVELAPGDYLLTEPLVFRPEDGGRSADLAVTYTACGDVRVSGGRRIGGWRTDGQQWTAPAGIDDDNPAFRDLWINDRRAVRARTPNEGYFRVEAAGADNRTSFVAAAEDFAEVAHLESAEVGFLHDWSMSRVRLAGVDAATRTYQFVDPIGGHMAQFAISNFEPHPRYFLENAPEWLDVAGEWRLDEAAGELRYLPRAGEAPETTEAIAPRLEKLVVIEGDGDRRVENLHFEGVTFAHTRFELPPHGYAGIQAGWHERRRTQDDAASASMPAAVEIIGARNCSFTDCRFEHLAASGLSASGCESVAVRRSTFRDVGGNGVMIGSPHAGDVPLAAANAIEDCVIQDCGATYLGAVGIWIGFARDTTVAGNEIRRLPYTGVSVGWQWNDAPTPCGGHDIRDNHIHHVMQALSDGGGIYTLGRQPGTRLRGNAIHDIPLNAGRAESNGIFMDEGSTEITVQNNTIYNLKRSPIRFHRAGKNLVEHNRLVAPPGVASFMYNATDAAVIQRVDNEEISAAEWSPPASDSPSAGESR
jgi:hypothetical protein